VSAAPRFDPYALLCALERHRVDYVLIGGFARVIQGTEELTDGLDLAPSTRPENLRRLALALDDLEAERVDGTPLTVDDEQRLRPEPLIELRTSGGELKLVPEAAGTRGGTTTSAAAPNDSPWARGSGPASPRSPTSPAWPPPSPATKTSHPSDSYARSPSSNAAATAPSTAKKL
jgi:hypothetical protein